MVITVRMTPDAVARTRLAVSPAAEAAVWLWTLVLGRSHPLFGDHGPLARAALRHPDVALVAGTLFPCYAPDLLTPPPPPASTLDDQLDLVSSARPDVVADQIGYVASRNRVPPAVRDAVDAGTFGRRAANGLLVFWRHVLADGWPALREVLEADLAQRMRTMASGGLASLFTSLHPDIGWTGDSLTITLGPHAETVALGDRDLVLVPTALNWPNATAQVCGDAPAVIGYPAAGLPRDGHRDPAAQARLYGATRAALLADLTQPRSTAHLAARHGIAPSTASYHLRVLHQAGLVSRHRDGHHVLYQRT
ncbi:Helix-turn-helix domain protein [Actinokineospora sp. UTMC 2448]|nr:Helix-turn-helix domain protein [Actinokineospora sp. UTMC 2448]